VRALCNDVARLQELLQTLQLRVIECADKHITCHTVDNV